MYLASGDFILSPHTIADVPAVRARVHVAGSELPFRQSRMFARLLKLPPLLSQQLRLVLQVFDPLRESLPARRHAHQLL